MKFTLEELLSILIYFLGNYDVFFAFTFRFTLFREDHVALGREICHCGRSDDVKICCLWFFDELENLLKI